jgi:NAD(P)-dependent dehydrogenase (short-subunit alcohol dehydrogenase family)
MALSLDLSGKRALITGVSSGIGLGVAGVMAEAGCDIVGCGLEATDSDDAQAFMAVVQQHGRTAHYTSLDVADTPTLRAWVADAADKLGGIDIVISNAGKDAFHGVVDATQAQWDRTFQVNLESHWQLVVAAKPHLDQAANPVVIITSSNHAFYTIKGCFPYNVAKAGLVAMTQSIAIECGPKIRAVALAPGFIQTPGADVWFNSFPDPAAERARTEAMHPAGRLGTPEEIGGMCAFLCSPYAHFITGTTIVMDGGRSAVMQDS